MKRVAGQVGIIIGGMIHVCARIVLTVFMLSILLLGLLAYRLSLGPVQIPYLAGKLANAASGDSIVIHISKAALAWGGYKHGGGAPLYLRLEDVIATNHDGVTLVDAPLARLVFLPGAVLGTKAPIMVNSADASFAGSNVTVSVLAAIRIKIGFKLARADLYVTLGPGNLGQPGYYMPITGGSFTLHVTPHHVELLNGQLSLTPAGKSAPVIGITGSGARDRDWQGQLTLTADQVQAADLGTYWPEKLADQTRNWVLGNITAGTGHEAKVQIDLAAPADLSDLSMTNMTGGFSATDLTMGWIPGAMPITGLNGTLSWVDKDNITITAATAALGGIALHDGIMKITGVAHKDQTGTVQVAMAGKLADAVAVLNAKPLSLLAQAPPEFTRTTGDATGDITAALPFKEHLTLAETKLGIDAKLTDVAIPGPFSGADFTEGALTLHATQSGMTVAGTALFAGQTASVSARADFTQSEALRDFEMKTVLGPKLLEQFGFDPQTVAADDLNGTVPLLVQVKAASGAAQQLLVEADLTRAKLGMAALGWSKQPGDPGEIKLIGLLSGNKLASISSLQANAPGLAVAGRMQNDELLFSQIRIGPSSGTGEVMLPAKPGLPWRIELRGPRLDVRVILNKPPSGENDQTAPTPAAGRPAGPLWQARLHFTQLRLAAAPAPALQNFAFDGDGEGARLLSGTASAVSEDGAPLRLTAAQAGADPNRRNAHLEAGDGGNLLRVLGAYDDIKGGALALDAGYGGGPVAGTVHLTDFRVLQAPAIGKVLQSLTIYGLAEAASGPGLLFDTLVAPFSISGGTLDLTNARAYSAALGFTASGRIGLADGAADLDATIVPLYALNSLPGKIPLIGKLFSAEKGGGLISVRAKITGPLTDPNVSINPLSALTPGLLRDVFGLGGAPK